MTQRITREETQKIRQKIIDLKSIILEHKLLPSNLTTVTIINSSEATLQVYKNVLNKFYATQRST